MTDQFEVVAATAFDNLIFLQNGVGQIESFDVTMTADHPVVVHRWHVDRCIDGGLSSSNFLGEVNAQNIVVLEQPNVVQLVGDLRFLLGHNVPNVLHTVLMLGTFAVHFSIRHIRQLNQIRP